MTSWTRLTMIKRWPGAFDRYLLGKQKINYVSCLIYLNKYCRLYIKYHSNAIVIDKSYQIRNSLSLSLLSISLIINHIHIFIFKVLSLTFHSFLSLRTKSQYWSYVTVILTFLRLHNCFSERKKLDHREIKSGKSADIIGIYNEIVFLYPSQRKTKHKRVVQGNLSPYLSFRLNLLYFVDSILMFQVDYHKWALQRV